ncbi:MAG: bacterioferritin [Gammaproteobacteria bacterium]|nr:MAG: bacterioferritin [Gammaproteobacteria bacterium]
MKGDKQVLKSLNTCLKDQLTAINQLFLHARMTKDWGLDEFNEHEYKCSIHAMKMADSLIERILFLESLPNLQDLGKLQIGEDVPEILSCDLDMLLGIRSNIQNTMKLCEDVKDYISRDILEDMLENTEEFIDWRETQQWLVKNTGLENYLQSQTGE